ncbi:putative disease resistance protein [Senna tora]|uniref:Putative disease resistance protein n=1 Tax=Senna tora TaxID=362788 RepID=A0A834T649_9FABA|nr:putative disease resistance protein [Senna tora]
MEEVTNTVVTKIVDCLMHQIKLQATYLLCLKQFDENLRDEKSELESKIVSVKELAKMASKRNEQVTDAVKKWQNEAEEILKEVQKLEEKVEKAKNKCFHVSFSYSLAKQVECKTQQMVKLKKGCQFEPFSLPIELEGMHYYSSKDFVYFKPTKSACNEILKAIEDGGTNMIGLYGIGGSGKTSLAKEVGRKIEESKLYDKVIMAVVSQSLDIKHIQDQISDLLHMKFDKQSIEGRAQQLSQKLKVGKTLIILDDVWEVINLEDIGIPSNDYKGCCVLLTTRLRRVCDSMSCQSVTELCPLTSEEAWDLFKRHANIKDDCSNELKGVARNITDECKGLPIAIVTVGSALKGKAFVEWKSALSRLKKSQPMDIEKGLRNPYACLELSYNHLSSSTAKSLFLLCSMFPEDYSINKEDLVRFGNGILVLGESIDSMEQVRTEIDVAINVLLDSCLLIPDRKRESIIKMHDLVRDVALWIARKERQAILVDRKAVPRLLMENETVKDTKVISLWDLAKNFKLSIHCQALTSLLLHSDELEFEEPNIYLGGMKALKVLALVRFSFEWSLNNWDRLGTWSMPQSIVQLTNLHTLCLRGNALGDISFLVTLVQLEILDLRGSSFDELPIEIADKKKLKLLDLYRCSIKKSPYEVIGKYWRLDILEYDVGDIEVSRALCMEGYNVSPISSSMNDLFLSAELLQLRKCRIDSKDYLSSKVKRLKFEVCPDMKFIVDDRIKAKSNNLEIEQVFSHLVTLELYGMESLEQVFQDSSINCSLQNLQSLSIAECPLLHNISFPKASNLCNLKKLVLFDCPMLKSALFTPSIAQTLVLLEELHISTCSKLKHIIEEHDEEGNVHGNRNDGSSMLAFQNLSTIYVHNCDELESILPLSFVWILSRLECIDVGFCHNLKYVIGGRKEDWVSLYQRKENKSVEIEINWPALKELYLYGVPELMGLFPQQCGPTTMEKGIWVEVTTTFNQLHNQSLPQSLQAFLNWERLLIEDIIGRFKGFFELKVANNGNLIKEQAPLKLKLNSLILLDFPELEFIWKGPTQILSLQSLREANIRRCSKLKTIFTSTVVTSLPELRELHVWECNELERIISADSDSSLPNLSAPSSHINAFCFSNLLTILIGKCNKLKCLFSYSLASHCPSLFELRIEDCSELERVVDGFKGKDVEESGEQEDCPLFPNLRLLTLCRLPKLTQIFPGFENRKLTLQHDIEGCPNLILLE